MLAAQQNQIDGQELSTINTKLLNQVSNVNAVHQKIKENSQLIKEETAALKGHLALRSEVSTSKNVPHNLSTYEAIDDSLQNPRYSHEETIDPPAQ